MPTNDKADVHNDDKNFKITNLNLLSKAAISHLKEQNTLYSFDVDNELPNKVICKAFLTLERSSNATYMKEKPLMLFLSSWRRFLPIYKIIYNYQAEDKNSYDTTTYLYNNFTP